MNKVELTKSVATRTGVTQKDAAVYVDAVVESIKDGMIKDGKVQIVGFGTFEVKERDEREGRNPQTGETMKIAACKTPKFKAGKALKDVVNEA